jgi:uncharacterized membrane protein
MVMLEWGMKRLLHGIYGLVLALWVGGMAMFTFLVTPAIFRSHERDAAGAIVDKLFPGYFFYNLVLAAVAALVLLGLWSYHERAGCRMSLFLVVLAVLLNCYVVFKLYPDIRTVKQEISSFETEPPDTPARKKFRRLHGISAVANLLLLADGVTLLLIKTRLKK